MALPHVLRLSSDSLARTTRKYGIGEPHITLAPEAMWLDFDEEDAAVAAAEQQLAGLGLIGPRGLDPELEDSLTALVRPKVEYYGWYHQDDTTYAVLAAAIGREALLAVRVGGQITLRQLKENELVDALLNELPNTPPLRFQSVSMPLAEVRAALDRPAAPGGYPRSASTPNAAPDIRLLQQLMSMPVSGTGQLFVAVRDELGRRTRVEHPIRVVDTTQGRLQNVTSGKPGAQTWVVVAPASRAALADRLHAMHKELSA